MIPKKDEYVNKLSFCLNSNNQTFMNCVNNNDIDAAINIISNCIEEAASNMQKKKLIILFIKLKLSQYGEINH